ncbi:MAG: hypothetical protein NUV81_03005 [bacterium]|nr:hypothetical protein [bacterium]
MSNDEHIITIPFSVVVLIPLLIFGGIFAFRSTRVNKTQLGVAGIEGAQNNSQNQNKEPVGTTISHDGIDVTVNSVHQTEDTTTISVAFNNHTIDLSDPEIAKRSFLDGMPARQFNVLSSGAGGHHVQAELVFDGAEGKRLLIGATEKSVFDFDLELL